MKFRISDIYPKARLLPSSTRARARILRAYRGTHYRTVPVRSALRDREKIKLSLLFEFAELPEPPKQKKRRGRAVAKATVGFFEKIARAVGKMFVSLGRATLFLLRKLAPLSRPRSISMLLGAFCAAITVMLISALMIGAYLISPYLLPYEEFVIPDLIGKDITETTEIYKDRVDFSVSYIYSSEHPNGTIISQYPAGGITKKQYQSSPLSPISLKVSLGTKTYRVENLVGMSERDALITLRENEVVTKIIKEYSDTARAGSVISTSPVADSILKEGEALTLRVSLGKRIKTVAVPDLYNLTESGACLTIEERGLTVGSISYEASSLPAGRVISQSPAPFEEVQEEEEVSFTVSAGDRFSSHLVPDLYGMTVEQARQKLCEVGIVIGSVYSVSSGAPSGTVVAQSPTPSSPILSSVTSVDLYISS